jgi:NAD(P)H-nitrite reductase large subunit
MRVHYFLRGTRYWADVLDETESQLILQRLQHEGVELHPGTQVKEALGRHGRLIAVQTQGGETIPCEVLAVAIGVRPRTELATRAGLVVDRGIVVNSFLETSAPDVFAAGDAAQVQDPVGGPATLDVLWSTALLQGRVAGANMAGGKCPYQKGVPFNVTQLAGLKVTIIGAVGKGKDEDLVTIARGDSECWRQLPTAWVVTDQEQANRVRLLIGERDIVGALVMGDQTWSRVLQRLILSRADITPVRHALTGGGADALSHLAEFYQRWEQTNARTG